MFSGEKWSVWLEFARDFKEFKKKLNIKKVNCRPFEKIIDEERNKVIFYVDNFRFEIDSYENDLIDDTHYLLDVYEVLNTKSKMNEFVLDIYKNYCINNFDDIDIYERKNIYVLEYKGYTFFFSSNLKLKNIKPIEEIKTIGDIKPKINIKELSNFSKNFIKKNENKEVKIYITLNNVLVLLCRDCLYVSNYEIKKTKKMDLNYFFEHGIDIICRMGSNLITFVCNGDLYCLDVKKSTVNKYFYPDALISLSYECDGKLFLVTEQNHEERFYNTVIIVNDKEILKKNLILINSYNKEKIKMNKSEYVVERNEKFYFIKNKFVTNKVFEINSMEMIKKVTKKKNNFPISYTEDEILIYRDGSIYGLTRNLASRYFYQFEKIPNEELEEMNENLMLTINI